MFSDIKKIYSLILLNQFMASTATLCIGLYNMSTGNGTTILIIRGLSFTGTFMFQLAMYCYAGSIIEYQCNKLSEYVFYSHWEAPCGRRLRNAVMMMIIRTKRVPKLTAGDFIDANLNTFGKILQFSISFYTLMSKDKVKVT